MSALNIDSFFPSARSSLETKESLNFACKTEQRSAINRNKVLALTAGVAHELPRRRKKCGQLLISALI